MLHYSYISALLGNHFHKQNKYYLGRLVKLGLRYNGYQRGILRKGISQFYIFLFLELCIESSSSILHIDTRKCGITVFLDWCTASQNNNAHTGKYLDDNMAFLKLHNENELSTRHKLPWGHKMSLLGNLLPGMGNINLICKLEL